jgi:hypothetical protein
MWGEAKDVATQYERFCWEEQGVVLDRQTKSENFVDLARSNGERLSPIMECGDAWEIASAIPDFLLKTNPDFEKNKERNRMGTGAVRIKNFVITNSEGIPTIRCAFAEQINFYYLLEAQENVASEFMLGIRFKDIRGNYIYSANNCFDFPRIKAVVGDRFLIKTSLRVPLHHQCYAIVTSVLGFQDGIAAPGGHYDFERAIVWDFIEEAAYLTVSKFEKMPLPGPVHADLNIKIQAVTSE